MKKILIIPVLLLCAVSLFAEKSIDLKKGQEAFEKGDYYSSLLFYGRVIDSGSTDGATWFKTAVSYEKVFGEDKLLTELYSVAFYYFLQSDPKNPLVEDLKSRIDLSLKINKSFIRKTRKQIVYRAQTPGEQRGVGVVNKSVRLVKEWSGFVKRVFRSKKDILLKTPEKFRKGSLGFGLRYILSHLELYFFCWVLISLPLGIILPSILAGSSRKNRGESSLGAAYLLWLHWGIFGIHRFYMGQYLRGLLMLLTLGGFGIGWLIDGLLLPKGQNRGQKIKNESVTVESNFTPRRQPAPPKKSPEISSFSELDDLLSDKDDDDDLSSLSDELDSFSDEFDD